MESQVSSQAQTSSGMGNDPGNPGELPATEWDGDLLPPDELGGAPLPTFDYSEFTLYESPIGRVASRIIGAYPVDGLPDEVETLTIEVVRPGDVFELLGESELGIVLISFDGRIGACDKDTIESNSRSDDPIGTTEPETT